MAGIPPFSIGRRERRRSESEAPTLQGHPPGVLSGQKMSLHLFAFIAVGSAMTDQQIHSTIKQGKWQGFLVNKIPLCRPTSLPVKILSRGNRFGVSKSYHAFCMLRARAPWEAPLV